MDRNLVGYSPWGRRVTSHNWVSNTFIPLFPWPIPHDFPALSKSNSDSYEALQGSSWRAPVASLPHPLPLPFHHLLSSSHPGPGLCSNTPGSFSAASAQGLLITEGFFDFYIFPYPHHSLSTKHLSPPGMGFSRLYCLSTSYKAYYLINFLFCCSPIPRDMFYGGKSISIWWIFVKGMNFPFHPHAKCTIIEETGFNKTPVSLFDDEACLYNYESLLTSYIMIGR